MTQGTPIALPDVSMIKGTLVTCADDKCGELKFFKAIQEEEALAYVAEHIALHQRHADRVNSLLGEYGADGEGNGPPPTLQCPGCTAPIGELHGPACDVARCLQTGKLRAFHEHNIDGHDCCKDAWTGYMNGELESWHYKMPVPMLLKYGRWDTEKHQWVLPDNWSAQMATQGDIPMPG